MRRVKRVAGIETEHGVAIYRDGKASMPDEGLLRLFGSTAEHDWLDNGACYYLDATHPEYATAECLSLLDLIAQDKAGERYLAEMTRRIERRFPGYAVYALKNNTDTWGETYGCHENYQLDAGMVSRFTGTAELARRSDIAVLASFLATRPLIAGSGGLVRSKGGVSYVLSPRAGYMEAGYNLNTTRSRGMFSVKQSLYDDGSDGRLQIISGDSTMSETTTLLKVGTTDLVLSMIAADVPLEDLILTSPVTALKTVSRDLERTQSLACAYGGPRTAVSLQRAWLDRARDFCSATRRNDPETDLVLDLWERVVTALESGNLTPVSGVVEWVLKDQLLRSYATKHGLSMQSARIAEMALAYHDVRPERGLYYLLQRRGAVERVIDDQRITTAEHTPPHTRAALRTAVVVATRETGGAFFGDWGRFHVRSGDGRQFELVVGDPVRARNADVDLLLHALDLGRAPLGAPQPPESPPRLGPLAPPLTQRSPRPAPTRGAG